MVAAKSRVHTMLGFLVNSSHIGRLAINATIDTKKV